MRGLVNGLKPFFKRPGMLAFISIFTMFFCFIEFNLIFPLMFGFGSIKGGISPDSIVHMVKLIYSHILMINPFQCFMVVALLFGISMILGFILSGLLYNLNNALHNKTKVKFEFFEGVKKHFIKLSLISFGVVVYSIMFILFMMVIMIPVIIVSRTAFGGMYELLWVALLFIVTTMFVLFFGSMFFRAYMLFWYPAALNFKSKFFSVGKYVADKYFWNVAKKLFILDIVFVVVELGLLYFNMTLSTEAGGDMIRFIILFMTNWIIKTLLLSMLIGFVFSKFVHFKFTLKQ